MLARLLTLLLIVALLAGSAWYLLRDTTQKQVERWRLASEYFFREVDDIEEAERYSAKILEVSKAAKDLNRQALIEERKGTPSSLNRALELYGEVAEKYGSRALTLHLSRSRVARRLGRYEQAQGMALSVADAYPFESTMALGAIALDRLQPRAALAHFQRALDSFAQDNDEKRARAYESIAAAYAQTLLFAEASPPVTDGLDDAERQAKIEAHEKLLASVKAAYRSALTEAGKIVREFLLLNRDINEFGPRLVSVSVKLHRLREAGETPCYDNAEFLEKRIKDSTVSGRLPDPSLHFRLGSLHMLAAWHEHEDLTEGAESLKRRGQEHFIRALPEEGRSAALKEMAELKGESEGEDLEEWVKRPVLKKRRSYVRNLMAIARLYLESPDFRTVIEDDSPLELSGRIAEARRSQDPDVKSAFSVILGFAHLKAGDNDKAREIFHDYLEQSGDAKSRVSMELAELCLPVAPESGFAFEYLDRFEESASSPLDYLTRRLRLLVSARRTESLAAEATRRMEETLRKARDGAVAPGESLLVARAFQSIGKSDEALAILSKASDKSPDDNALNVVLARLLLESARRDLAGEAKESALAASRKALKIYLDLLVRNPAASSETALRSRMLVEFLEKESPGESLAPLVKEIFPVAGEPALESFGEALRFFLKEDHEQALEKAGAIPSPDPFRPFLSYLVGACHLRRAAEVKVEAIRGGSGVEAAVETSRERSALARKALLQDREFPAIRLELARCDLLELGGNQDVPDALMARLDELCGLTELEHGAFWLRALAFTHRFNALYPDRSIEDQRLMEVLGEARESLRMAIERRPDFVPAYVALADSYVLRRDESAGEVSRESLPAEYDKAIDTLRNAPHPDVRIFGRLARHLEEAGERKKARPYLWALNFHQPVASWLPRLINNYVESGELEAAEVILNSSSKAPEGKQKEVLERLRTILAADGDDLTARRLQALVVSLQSIASDESLAFPVHLALHERLSGIPRFEGIRQEYLAQLSVKKRESSGPREIEAVQREIIDRYSKAMEFYEKSEVPVPRHILNNLAWYMVELDGVPEYYARGLEIAERMVKGGADAPANVVVGMRDTHGWALYRNGRFAEAKEIFRSIVEKSGTPSFRYRFARVLEELGEYEGALEQLDRALGSRSEFPERSDAQARRRDIRSRPEEPAGTASNP